VVRLVRARHRWQPRLGWIAGAVGMALFAAGVVVLFTNDHDARSGFLLTLGLVLFLVAALGNRVQLEGFEILGAKVRVREVVKLRLELASSPESGGTHDPARLRRQAAMLQELVGLYELYEHIRATEPPGQPRTKTLSPPTAVRNTFIC
jgi:hypothetical protein